MHPRSVTATLLLCTLSAAGCRPTPRPFPPPTAATTTGARLDQQRRLALLPCAGHAPVDAILDDLQQRAARDPRRLDTWVALGRAWVQKARVAADPGYYLNADAAADVALALAPDHPSALDVKGLVLLNEHRFTEARALAAGVVARLDFDPVAWGTLSDAELELGHFDAAVAAARKMMALKPNLPAYARAAYLQWLQGQLAEARESMRLAIDAAPRNRADGDLRAWALTQAALLFWHEGDLDGADAGFALALSGLADYPPALVGRARVALARGQAITAAAWLEQAYAQSPLTETAWLLGDARTLAGDPSGAARAYQLVMQQGRRSDPRTLALYLATVNRTPAEALALAKEEASKRGDIYTADVYAWALYRAGRLHDAAAAAERATRLGTRDARLWYHLGAIRAALGDVDGGRQWARRALALNPAFDLVGAREAAQLAGAGAPTARR
jgi:tetratricopeptide (TPR) repeat protein